MARSKLLIAAAFTLFAYAAHAEMLTFQTTLTGKNEVPAKNTQGAGTVTAMLDTATKKLDYKGEWHDLSGQATMAHFHGPAAPGSNAGVVVPWGVNLTSPFTGTATLTDAQIADLEAGKWYTNVHSAKYPAGEIRGQMVKQ